MLHQESLLEQLQHIALNRASEPLQQAAWKKFLVMGLPKKEDEAFRYLSLRELYEQNFSLPAYQVYDWRMTPTDGVCQLVFVDGVLSKSLSKLDELPKEVTVCSMKEAKHSYGALLRSRASKMLQETRNSSFAVLNDALYDEGLFLYIPPKVVVKKPIEIVELYSSDVSALYFPKFVIYIGKHAQVTFDVQVKNLNSNEHIGHFVNRSIEFHLDAHSKCCVYNHLLDLGKAWYFDQVAFYLKRDASASYVSGDIGSKLVRQDFKIDLLEENAEVFLKGLSILQKKDQSHHCVQVNHLAPHCRSSQHFKGVLFDQSVLSFEGKIWVDRLAQKTEAYQLSNHLILGAQARAYSKPNLEIFADDVKASHGATVAQLREEEIFYLQARGLHPSLAKKILVKGFCKELMKEMTPALRDELLVYLQKGLER